VYPFDEKLQLHSATTNEGEDVGALIATPADSNFYGYPGDEVIVNFGPGEGWCEDLYLMSDLKQPTGSILIQELAETVGGTDWQTVTVLVPRKDWGEDVIPHDLFGPVVGDSLKVRLVWTKEHKLDEIALISAVTTTLDEHVEKPSLAAHTVDGSVELALLHEDALTTNLGEGEAIYLSFEAPELQAGWIREFVLRTQGWWAAMDPGSYGRLGANGVASWQFPRVTRTSRNPFRSEFRMTVSVPDERWITAVVYDVQGRRVRTVVDEPFEPGNFEVVWDGRTDQRREAGPGVYFVRMMANGRTVYHDNVVRVP
jgi:hypothetical protein